MGGETLFGNLHFFTGEQDLGYLLSLRGGEQDFLGFLHFFAGRGEHEGVDLIGLHDYFLPFLHGVAVFFPLLQDFFFLREQEGVFLEAELTADMWDLRPMRECEDNLEEPLLVPLEVPLLVPLEFLLPERKIERPFVPLNNLPDLIDLSDP